MIARNTIVYRSVSSIGALICLTALETPLAQTVQQGGSSGTTFTSPVGATLIPQNPAAPVPSSTLSYGLTQPERRGYLNAEPFFIYPTIRMSVGQLNNVNSASTGAVNSPVLQLAPRVTAEAKSGGHTHAFTYQGLLTRYSKSSDDNFNDHELVARTRNQYSARADLNGEAYYLQRNEARGQFARENGLTPDRFNAFGFNGTAGYGAQAAQGRFEVDLGFTDKTYQTNPLITKALDVSSFNLGGRFLYRVTPRMRLLAELRDTEFNYKSSNLDNAERRALIGASLDAGAAISGTAKFGIVNKNFKDGSFKDYTAPAAEVALRWTPLTYSSVDLVVQRVPRDTTGTQGASGTIDTVLGGYWVHRWQSYLGTYAALSFVNQDFKNISRTDKLNGANLGVYFDIRSWLRLSVDYSYSDRKTTVTGADYKRDALLFTVGATL